MANILLVDDDENVLYSLNRVLERQGYLVYQVENGAKAQEALIGHEFDLMITDLIMPETDGIELIRSTRQSHPNLKILAVSGGGRVEKSEYLTMAQCLGADDVLEKPIQTEEFINKVKTLLGS